MYKMYLCAPRLNKVLQPCPHCSAAGIVLLSCNMCGGTGIREITKKIREVRSVEIVKIDRAVSPSKKINGIREEEGDLRYWTSSTDYIPEASKLVHFNRKDAEVECHSRNVKQNGEEFMRVYNKNITGEVTIRPECPPCKPQSNNSLFK